MGKLAEAVGNHDVKAVQVLLAGEYQDKQLFTEELEKNGLLHIAAGFGYAEVLELLLKAGADSEQMSDGWTPLHTAASASELKCLEALLAQGAEINKVNSRGQTALYLAAYWGYTEAAKLLIQRGADVTLKTPEGLTALEIAEKEKRTDLVKMLEPLFKAEVKETSLQTKSYLPQFDYLKQPVNEASEPQSYLPDFTDYKPKPISLEAVEAYEQVNNDAFQAEARQWILKAKEGNALAQFNIGCCYYNGSHGMAQNYKAAVFWYDKSAKLGSREAQNILGNCYKKGDSRGVLQKDMQQAMQWFGLAAKQGYTAAQFNLAACYQETAMGCSEPQKTSDFQKAVYWYGEAAKQNHKDAPYYLGLCFEKGWGVAPNREAALGYYVEARKRGCAAPAREIEKSLSSLQAKFSSLQIH